MCLCFNLCVITACFDFFDCVVSESLMAFQQAEQLVQQNADDADIVAVIEQQRQYPQMHHEQKGKPIKFGQVLLN